MNERGVFSVDFLLSIMILFLIFSGFINIISERTNLEKESEKLSQSRVIIEKISSTLNKVYCGGNGQKTEVYLPEKIGNSIYSIKIKYSSVYVELEVKTGKSNHYPMLIVDSNLKIANEIIMLPGKSYTIETIPLNHSSAVIINETK